MRSKRFAGLGTVFGKIERGMSWILLCALVVAAALFALVAWRKWKRALGGIEDLIRQISRDERPPTFLIDGGRAVRRIGLALEDIFLRQAQLKQQIVERASGTEAILSAMQDGLLVVDARRRITLANQTFQDLFDLKKDPVGASLLEVVRDPALDRLIAESVQKCAAERSEFTIHDPENNSIRRMQLSAVPMKNDLASITGVVVLFHDITQLRQADEIRRDFVANVSHELRTPLSILRGYIETLLDDPQTSRDELARILEVMRKHSNRLGTLVDDLLTLARLESANPDLQLSDVRLSELFAAIVHDWATKFTEKKLSLGIVVAPDLPVIRADETRLQEVLYNLLDNALKYTQPGGKIRLQADRQGDEVAVSVTDTGIGIDEADLPRVFERFYRADKARSRELGGTGLGLSIVKHIAQMHGGRVEAESKLGRGTIIRVLLPLNGAEESEVRLPA
jgi:two-component system phosphate regulon sensor histidine kinase PhoR